jgi:hypothetical protein
MEFTITESMRLTDQQTDPPRNSPAPSFWLRKVVLVVRRSLSVKHSMSSEAELDSQLVEGCLLSGSAQKSVEM